MSSTIGSAQVWAGKFAAVAGSAPTVTAISPTIGPIAGGQTVDITVSDSSGCTGASVGGVALTSFSIVNATTVRGTTGSHAAAANTTVEVTNAYGTGSLTNAYEYYDPDTALGADEYWHGDDYGGTNWTGRIGSFVLTGSANPPDSGSTVNGHYPVDFDPASSERFTGGSMTSNFVSVSRGWVAILINVRSISTNQGSATAYANQHIVAESGGVCGMALRTDTPELQSWVYDTAMNVSTQDIDLGVGAWELVFMKWDGSNVYSRQGKGSWDSVASGNVNASIGNLIVGSNYNGVQFFDGLIGELQIGGKTNAIPSDATFDRYVDYVAAMWGQSLA